MVIIITSGHNTGNYLYSRIFLCVIFRDWIKFIAVLNAAFVFPGDVRNYHSGVHTHQQVYNLLTWSKPQWIFSSVFRCSKFPSCNHRYHHPMLHTHTAMYKEYHFKSPFCPPTHKFFVFLKRLRTDRLPTNHSINFYLETLFFSTASFFLFYFLFCFIFFFSSATVYFLHLKKGIIRSGPAENLCACAVNCRSSSSLASLYTPLPKTTI